MCGALWALFIDGNSKSGYLSIVFPLTYCIQVKFVRVYWSINKKSKPSSLTNSLQHPIRIPNQQYSNPTSLRSEAHLKNVHYHSLLSYPRPTHAPVEMLRCFYYRRTRTMIQSLDLALILPRPGPAKGNRRTGEALHRGKPRAEFLREYSKLPVLHAHV
jgi:hypothetical protein